MAAVAATVAAAGAAAGAAAAPLQQKCSDFGFKAGLVLQLHCNNKLDYLRR